MSSALDGTFIDDVPEQIEMASSLTKGFSKLEAGGVSFFFLKK